LRRASYQKFNPSSVLNGYSVLRLGTTLPNGFVSPVLRTCSPIWGKNPMKKARMFSCWLAWSVHIRLTVMMSTAENTILEMAAMYPLVRRSSR
jgi:hypothetical protein